MRILVSGAGVAGLSAGIDLARAGHTVEIVERSNALRTNGSPIDIRGEAIGIARRMGILDAVLERRITMTENTKFVDRDGGVIATLPADEISDSGDDVEIPREDLMHVLRRALPEQVHLRFEDSIRSLVDNEADTDADSATGVRVTFASGREAAYDLVVGADGVHSAVRGLVFGPERQFTQHLGVYTAIADAPGQAEPGNRTSEVLNLPSRTIGVARYRDRALAVFYFRAGELDYDHHDPAAHQRILAGAFDGYDCWKVSELVACAQADPRLYFDAVAQVHLPVWHDGRVVLIGDAAHCATPLAGRGTSLALLGAWILTEELDRHGAGRTGRTAAFAEYERRQRVHADRAQRSAHGGADLVVPATEEAIGRRDARLRALSQ